MPNPLGFDGAPMEGHHIGRLKGPTEIITQTEHHLIHQGEIDTVRDILRMDNLKGNPNGWTGKRIPGEGI